jgi:hypothetical protein
MEDDYDVDAMLEAAFQNKSVSFEMRTDDSN